MRVSQKWLRDYIDFRFSPGDLSDRLSMLGVEIEGVEDLGAKYDKIVVGKVTERRPHPNADRLSVCSVSVGREDLQIVCGAPNVAAGQRVAVGLVGAMVPRNQHDPDGKPFMLTNAKIRGVESHGMICSAYELDLGDDVNGILVLDQAARVGSPLAKHLGLDDVVLDIEITANRPDLLSHIGVAREIGALTGKLPKLPSVKHKETNRATRDLIRVKVYDRENCKRFAVRLIRNVKVGPSPKWMHDRLVPVGLRPRNNVVDVTNYVMYECGQPLHAFDYNLVEGSILNIRRLQHSVSLTTLDGKVRSVPAGATVVCDSEKEISIAGIMGGANTEINDSTVDIILESAYWNPSSIRRTRKSLGLITDASQRFERGADPNATDFALDRAAQLVAELSGGTILRGKVDDYPNRIQPRSIPLRPERVNAMLGTDLSKVQISRHLRSLGLLEKKKAGKTVFSVPTFRVDLEREIDLVEEVARVYGYNNIAVSQRPTVDLKQLFPIESPVEKVRSALIGFGYQEALTVSLTSPEKPSPLKVDQARVLNAQNKEMSVLRTSLVPGLLSSIAYNIDFGSTDIRLFEIGNVFSLDRSSRMKIVGDFLEEERVCLAATGAASPLHWKSERRPVNFFDLKGDIRGLLESIVLDKSRFISYSTTETLCDDALAIEINGSYVGYLGRMKSEVLKAFGLEQEVFVAELSTVALHSDDTKLRYTPISKFPRVARDIAVVVQSAVDAGRVQEVIAKASSSLVYSVVLFDVYEGEKLGAGLKSLAFRIEFVSPERTLRDEEVDDDVRKIVGALEQELDASLRSV